MAAAAPPDGDGDMEVGGAAAAAGDGGDDDREGLTEPMKRVRISYNQCKAPCVRCPRESFLDWKCTLCQLGPLCYKANQERCLKKVDDDYLCKDCDARVNRLASRRHTEQEALPLQCVRCEKNGFRMASQLAVAALRQLSPLVLLLWQGWLHLGVHYGLQEDQALR